MARSSLTKVVRDHFEPLLKEHGFGVSSGPGSRLVFHRTHRGFFNEIILSMNSLPGVKLISLSLEAPKGLGMPLDARRVWGFATEDDPAKYLPEIERVILDKGLKRLDDYTPGNVPDWTALMDECVTQSVEKLGFAVLPVRNQPDMMVYQHRQRPDQVIVIDLRIPGVVTARLEKQPDPAESAKVAHGPSQEYGDGRSLREALLAICEYLLAEAPGWFGR